MSFFIVCLSVYFPHVKGETDLHQFLENMQNLLKHMLKSSKLCLWLWRWMKILFVLRKWVNKVHLYFSKLLCLILSLDLCSYIFRNLERIFCFKIYEFIEWDGSVLATYVHSSRGFPIECSGGMIIMNNEGEFVILVGAFQRKSSIVTLAVLGVIFKHSLFP